MTKTSKKGREHKIIYPKWLIPYIDKNYKGPYNKTTLEIGYELESQFIEERLKDTSTRAKGLVEVEKLITKIIKFISLEDRDQNISKWYLYWFDGRIWRPDGENIIKMMLNKIWPKITENWISHIVEKIKANPNLQKK